MSPSGWSLAPGFAPVYKSWDGETLLYDQFSGDTHIVDSMCIAVIESLSTGRLSEDQLLEQMARRFDVEPGIDLGAMLRQRLDALVRLNMLQCLK